MEDIQWSINKASIDLRKNYGDFYILVLFFFTRDIIPLQA